MIVITALAPYQERGDRVIVDGSKTAVNASSALILGMVLHELATNAAKYGALSTQAGEVEVTWNKDLSRNRLLLVWSESKGPRIAGPAKKKGFGLGLIERALAHELKGQSTFDFRSIGLRCTIILPLTEIAVEVPGRRTQPRAKP